MTKNEPISDFHKSLQTLAKKLTKEEYSLVAGTMFQLHAGMTFGYKKVFDPQLLPDIEFIWRIHHGNKIKKKAEVIRLRVITGGKNAPGKDG
jgi:hypothetical protein